VGGASFKTAGSDPAARSLSVVLEPGLDSIQRGPSGLTHGQDYPSPPPIPPHVAMPIIIFTLLLLESVGTPEEEEEEEEEEDDDDNYS